MPPPPGATLNRSWPGIRLSRCRDRANALRSALAGITALAQTHSMRTGRRKWEDQERACRRSRERREHA